MSGIPKCDCGGRLDLIEVKTIRRKTIINQNGELANTSSIVKYSETGTECSFLKCRKCSKHFNWNFINGTGIVERLDEID